ncbi:ribosomal protein eL22-like isoform X2 [Ammospiza nelsoni]|uniref:ribosomal protein eL22-like isoform X2 n=1 Tax=Ammospiza nelsoni TaxID=2857394 RepID=UPI002869D333|nr:ribosomal protein eL22-like isoform X2 [Ammospiza nelsoni]
MAPQKDRKSKKSTWKFCLDLTHPVEDGIFDSGNFVPEVPDQEVPEEEQPAGLAARGGVRQGDVRAALLPDQPGRGGLRVRGVSQPAFNLAAECRRLQHLFMRTL